MTRRAARLRAEIRRQLDAIEAEHPAEVADAIFREVIEAATDRKRARAVQETRR